MDLFFNVFAKWAFKVDIDGEAAKRMCDVLSKFQTQMDFANRYPVSTPIGHAAQNGLDLGRMIVRRAFQIKQGWMVPAISHFFVTSQLKAEQALNTMGEEEFVAYTEWGHASWMDAQLREKLFFDFANRSLKAHFLEMKEKTKVLGVGRVVDAGDDEDRGEDYNDGQGRMLTDKEVTEISYYMDFIFIKTGGVSLGP
ncbi:hypothetical protein IFR04_002619 [Cadophora malorum]|uniref:Uncharacterized protein n=1 Tax=Cadophora malorum TaxID=108018 RepID=A0A8H7WG47_9HELO|nr:hypothetical protein IFR04_002619 [Cadophora malorum]